MARRLIVEIVGDSRQLEASFKRANKSAQGFTTNIERTFARGALGTGNFGRSIALASTSLLGGAGLIAGVKGAVDAAAEFDRQMRNVNSIAGLSERSLGRLRETVLAMAGPVAQAPETLARGLYDIESSGFAARDAVKVLRASARAATAGLTDTATAARAISAALNAYHLSADDARRVSDVLFQTVNKGVLTFEELSQNMGDLVPAAAPLGVRLEEVSAAIATITLQGVPAAEAATRVKNAMLLLAHPSAALSKTLRSAGYASGEAAVQARGFAGVLELLDERTRGSVAATHALAPEIRALLGVVGLTGKNLATYQGILESMSAAQEGAGITSRVFAEQSRSSGVQFQKLGAQLKALRVQIGDALLPDILRVTSAMSKWLSSSENQQKVTDGVREAAAALKAIVTTLYSILQNLNRVTGSTVNTMKALLGVWVAMKALKIVTYFADVATSLGRVATTTKTAEDGTKRLALSFAGKAGLVGLVGAASFGVTTLALHATGLDKKLKSAGGAVYDFAHGLGLAGSNLEDLLAIPPPSETLAATIRDQAAAFREQGKSIDEVREALEKLHPEIATRDLQVLAGMMTGSVNPAVNPYAAGPVPPPGFGQRQAPATIALSQVASDADREIKKVLDEARQRPKISVAQLNAWFDTRISRALDRVQDLPIKRQIARLREIAALIEQRRNATKDVTRRNNLEDQIIDVQRRIKAVRADQAQAAETLFDSDISRALDRVDQLVPQAQISALRAVAKRLQERITVTKDIVRKRELEDQLTAVLRRQRETRREIALGEAEFAVERADATRTLADDIAARQRERRLIERLMREDGSTIDLRRDLLRLDTEIDDLTRQRTRNQRERAQRRREGALFRRLGLTATGEERVAGLKTLRAELRQINKAVADGLIEIDKNTRARLKTVGKILSGDDPGRNVRRAIEGMLDPIRKGSRDADREWTKFRSVNAKAFIQLAGLDALGPRQRRRIETLLARMGPGMTLPAERSLAFAPTGRGGMRIQNVNLYGVQDLGQFENQLAARAKARPSRRRGS